MAIGLPASVKYGVTIFHSTGAAGLILQIKDAPHAAHCQYYRARGVIETIGDIPDCI
jgi:hypothetical protein